MFLFVIMEQDAVSLSSSSVKCILETTERKTHLTKTRRAAEAIFKTDERTTKRSRLRFATGIDCEAVA